MENQEETLISRCELPIIDLAHIGTETCPTNSAIKRIGAQLHKAFTEKGMAILVNHGIADEKLKAVYKDLDNFCALPEKCQEQYLRNPDNNHGYIKPGMEKFDSTKVELRHAYNITSLSEGSLPADNEVPAFAQHASCIASDFTALSRLVLRAISVGLKLPYACLEEKHSGMLKSNNSTTLRLLLYPPVPPKDDDRNNQDSFIRCAAHADYGTITLLAQDSDGGLEVQLAGSGKWQAVGHLPGAIFVQPGELLAAWTGGRYPALHHRVVVPHSVYARACKRHAVAFFCHPDDDTEPTQLIEVVPAEVAVPTRTHHTLQGRLITAATLLQKRFRETYA